MKFEIDGVFSSEEPSIFSKYHGENNIRIKNVVSGYIRNDILKLKKNIIQYIVIIYYLR